MKHFLQGLFFGVRDPDQFGPHLQAVVNAYDQHGVYASDNLLTFTRTLGFLDDTALMTAFRQHAHTGQEQGILWRTAVLAWAARHCLQLPGDFVECGCLRGTTARILCDIIDFPQQARRYWLYDSFDFDHPPPGTQHPRGHDLYDQVCQRFTDCPNVQVVRGWVPEVLTAHSPAQIALLHLDLNSAAAEMAVLEAWFSRVVPGGLIILDDYGWLMHQEQHTAQRAFFQARQHPVLELPTGQGLVFRHGAVSPA